MLSLIKEIYSYIATGYTGRNWKPRKRNFGERPTQLQFKLSFIARIYIDMKACFNEFKKALPKEIYKKITPANRVRMALENYQAFKRDFKESGSIRNCPDYVYFIGE